MSPSLFDHHYVHTLFFLNRVWLESVSTRAPAQGWRDVEDEWETRAMYSRASAAVGCVRAAVPPQSAAAAYSGYRRGRRLRAGTTFYTCCCSWGPTHPISNSMPASDVTLIHGANRPLACPTRRLGGECWVVGQITGHLWHHIAGSWAHIPWLELALSLCLCHTLSLCLRTCTLHPSLISLVTAVTVTFPLFAMVHAYA